MYERNIQILEETLEILDRGRYCVNGKTIRMKLTREKMREARVYLPDEVKMIAAEAARSVVTGWDCEYSCVNMDSFSSAIRLSKEIGMPHGKNSSPVLVLNFANPVNIGGGVRNGAKAQEEDLCRKSSLLISLESREAVAYYIYNRNLGTYMGSDALIISPWVEIIRDEDGALLEETETVAVLTCAAPMITRGMEGLSPAQYRDMLYGRIRGMLACAARSGYDTLVLGAWGCGAFGNDAALMSDLFRQVLEDMQKAAPDKGDPFRRIEFAVLSRSASQYNFREFAHNFSGEHVELP